MSLPVKTIQPRPVGPGGDTTADYYYFSELTPEYQTAIRDAAAKPEIRAVGTIISIVIEDDAAPDGVFIGRFYMPPDATDKEIFR